MIHTASERSIATSPRSPYGSGRMSSVANGSARSARRGSARGLALSMCTWSCREGVTSTPYTIKTATAAMGLFCGQDFTKARGYEGPGEGVGNRVIPRTFYGPGNDFDERASAWRQADEWMAFIGKTFPAATTFLYLPDEPGRSAYAYIRRLADNLHSNPGPGRALPTFVTKHYVKELDGS